MDIVQDFSLYVQLFCWVSSSPQLCLSRDQVCHTVCSGVLLPSFSEQGCRSSVPPACLCFPFCSPSPSEPGQGEESRVWCYWTWVFRSFLKSQFKYRVCKYVQPLGHLIVINLEGVRKSGCIETSFFKICFSQKFQRHMQLWEAWDLPLISRAIRNMGLMKVI